MISQNRLIFRILIATLMALLLAVIFFGVKLIVSLAQNDEDGRTTPTSEQITVTTPSPTTTTFDPADIFTPGPGEDAGTGIEVR